MHAPAVMHSVYQQTWRCKVFIALQSLLILYPIPQTMSFPSPCGYAYNGDCPPPPPTPLLSQPPPPPLASVSRPPPPTLNTARPPTTMDNPTPTPTAGPPITPSTADPPTSITGPVPTTTPTSDNVWVKNKYPASEFRSEVAVSKFILWPENLSYVRFNYYCEDAYSSAKKLEDFTYEEGDTILHTNPYFDVGLVDKYYTPYFSHWRFWQTDTKRLACNVKCEYTDLQRLYTYRLYRSVLPVGFGWALVALSILQLGVAAYIIVVWTTKKRKGYQRGVINVCGSLWKEYKKVVISEGKWISDVIADWMHLGILVMVGFCLMEAVGHSDRFGWRSMLMYNTAVSYTHYTCFALISSFLHQCAYYFKSRGSELTRCMALTRSPSVSLRPPNAATAQSTLKSLVQLSDDWRWQRVFGQLGVLVLISNYLLFVDDDSGTAMDSLASIVLGAVVVACIWSNGVSLIIVFRSVRSIMEDHNSSHSVTEVEKGVEYDMVTISS